MDDPFLSELERHASNANASTAYPITHGPTYAEIQRWMHLFNYTQPEARYLIQNQRDDITHPRITDEHWDLVSAAREAAGYDREADEHVLRLGDLFLEQCVTIPRAAGQDETPLEMIRLVGILEGAEKVKEIAGLDVVPEVVEIISGEGVPARLCKVDSVAKGRVKEWWDLQRVLKTGTGRDGR